MARRSKAEQTIEDWFPKEEIVFNDRKMLGVEIDLWFPKYKLASEVDDPMWHTEFHGRDENYHANKFQAIMNKSWQFLTFSNQDVKERADLAKSIIERDIFKTYKINVKMCKPTKASVEEMQQFVLNNSLNSVRIDKAIMLGLDDKKGLASVVYGHYTYDIDGSKQFVVCDWVHRPGVTVLGGFVKSISDVASTLNLRYIPCMFAGGSANLAISELALHGHREYTFCTPAYKLVKNAKVFQESELDNSVGYARMYDYGKVRFCYTNPKGTHKTLESSELPFVEPYSMKT